MTSRSWSVTARCHGFTIAAIQEQILQCSVKRVAHKYVINRVRVGLPYLEFFFVQFGLRVKFSVARCKAHFHSLDNLTSTAVKWSRCMITVSFSKFSERELQLPMHRTIFGDLRYTMVFTAQSGLFPANEVMLWSTGVPLLAIN